MKIIITENKLYNSIYKYIDNFYDTSNIVPIDMGNEWDINSYLIEYFYKDDFEDDDGMPLFIHIEKKYYEEDPSNISFRNQSPILIVSNYGDFTDMFGDYWKEPMKQWFEDNYNLPVKTIVAD